MPDNHKHLPRGPEQGFGHCLRSRGKCRCQTAAVWSGSVSACSAGEPHRWPAAAGSPVTKKKKRMARCCTAAVVMALRSGSVGNGDSHWSLQRKKWMWTQQIERRLDISAWGARNWTRPLHAVVENEAGRGPLGLTEGRGGMVELARLLGADLEWVLASTGEPGMAGLFFSLLSVQRGITMSLGWTKSSSNSLNLLLCSKVVFTLYPE